MPHPLTGRARQCAASLAAAALLALPLPAVAQNATAPNTAAAAADPAEPLHCTPGSFGQGVSLTADGAESDAVTALHLDFQCGDVLSDGTFIPTGYRAELEGECGEGPCNYPLAFLMPTAHENRFEGIFVTDEGEDMILRLRKNRNGAMLVVIKQTPGSGDKPERMRIKLTEG